MKRRALLALMVLAISAWASPAFAAAHCRVSVSAVRFGFYNAAEPRDTRGLGEVVYNCSAATPITITLSRGHSNSYDARHMVHGTSTLAYNLYLDPATTAVWGDGTGGSQAYRTIANRPNTNVIVPIFGRIPRQQMRATVGAYDDTLVIEVEF